MRVHVSSKQDRKLEKLDRIVRQSIVQIEIRGRENRSDRVGLGFFVAVNVILTSLFITEDTKLESIKIESGKYTYKAIRIESKLNVSYLEIEINEDKDIFILELDSGYEESDELYIYQKSFKDGNITRSKPSFSNRSLSQGVIRFNSQQIVNYLAGSPLFNMRTGKICGLISYQSNSPVPIKNSIRKTKETSVSAILAGSIFEQFPSLKKLNRDRFSIRENLPQRTYGRFVGRELEIGKLLSTISQDYRQHIIIVDGVAGIGKTSLVLKVAYKCLLANSINNKEREYYQDIKIPTFDCIIFVSLNNNKEIYNHLSALSSNVVNPGLLLIIREIAETSNDIELDEIYGEKGVNKIYEYLGKQSSLLILDGIDDIASGKSEQILDFVNNVPPSTKVIITTRQQSLFYSHINLSNLSKRESEELIESQNSSKAVQNISAGVAQKITDAINGMPLALIYAVGQYRSGYPLESIITSTETSPNADIGQFYFKKTVEFIREKNKDMYHIMMYFAFFPKPALGDALINITGIPLKGINKEDLFSSLQQISLISEHSERKGYYSIIPISREYIILELAALTESDPQFERDARERWVDWYRNFIKKSNQEKLPDEESIKVISEDELVNIGEVLFWCADREDYKTVKEIWLGVDSFVKVREWWIIRLYWWQYLEKESQKQGDMLTYFRSLLAKASTYLAIGKEHCDEARDCLRKATSFQKYANPTEQEELARSLEILNNSCGEIAMETSVPFPDLHTPTSQPPILIETQALPSSGL
jgi:hypothetical protein